MTGIRALLFAVVQEVCQECQPLKGVYPYEYAAHIGQATPERLAAAGRHGHPAGGFCRPGSADNGACGNGRAYIS